MPSCVKALQYGKFMLKSLHFYPWSMSRFCELLAPFPGRCCSNYYWIAFRFDDEKKQEAYNPPEETQFKILVNGFDDPVTTLKRPGPQ